MPRDVASDGGTAGVPGDLGGPGVRGWWRRERVTPAGPVRRRSSPADGDGVADRSSTSAGHSPARWWHRHAPGWREIQPGWQRRAAAALLVAVLGGASVTT
ncbi:hypothetical protein [Pseudokineococcus marinus]|uniref:Uncharacterized protein n=1 Tax=Pseudokineococcus marinus TaxID=351215 RepID=A0A849BTX6_9ACTN|nr:hypothetical protein [Pseudokineococcus marinus]NNH24272.1 hypothetical protein [Pseudokineococcus marinus]